MNEPIVEPPAASGDRVTALPFKIVISTTHREPCFLHQTLASLFMAGSGVQGIAPVHLMVGSLEDAYLENYAHHGAVQAHLLGKREWQRIATASVHRRCCYNYARCLALPPGESRGLLICEDDIVFQEGFFETLTATIAEIELARGAVPFVLALYACYDFRSQPAHPGGLLYAAYEARGFYGTQCVYYSRPLLPDLAALMFREGFELATAPSDLLVKQYCLDKEILFATRVSLVQHIGKTTTGLGKFHASSTFGCTLPAPRQDLKDDHP